MKARIMGRSIDIGEARLSGTPPTGRRNRQAGGYRSKLEARFAEELERQRAEGKWDMVRYEPITFRLAHGVRYTPDFVRAKDNRITIYEVKGWGKNRRDGITRLKWLAKDWPMFTCILVEYRRGAWDYTIV